jgi:hypothetical protein
MKNILSKLFMLAAVCLLTNGCAQVWACKQAPPFKPTCLSAGTKRIDVVAELGKPIASEERTNILVESYHYVDGGSKNNGASKTVRVILYTAGDLFTLWLDQIIWMPTEKFGFAGTDHSVTIDYDKNQNGTWCIKTFDDRIVKGQAKRKEE